MKPMLVLYATREGQTRRIAAELRRVFRSAGNDAVMYNIGDSPPSDFAEYAGVVLAASVHLGKHEREMVAFAKRRRAQLEQLPNAFVSVSLTEACVEEMGRLESDRAAAADEVRGFVRDFLEETQWHPLRVKPVAGAIRYTQYGWPLRSIMQRVAGKLELNTDTSHDVEYTNYNDLDDFAVSFLAFVEYSAQQVDGARDSAQPKA